MPSLLDQIDEAAKQAPAHPDSDLFSQIDAAAAARNQPGWLSRAGSSLSQMIDDAGNYIGAGTINAQKLTPDPTNPDVEEAAMRFGLPAAAMAAAPVSGGMSIPLALGAAGGVTGEILAQQNELARGARDQASYGRMVAAGLTAGLPLGPEASLGTQAFDQAGNLLAVGPLTAAKRAMFGGAIGAGADVAEQKIDTGNVNWPQVFQSGAWGTLFGGAMGGLETIQATRAAKDALFQLRKATGNFASSDSDFMDWLRAQRMARSTPSMPATEGAAVPEEQIQALPAGYSETPATPTQDSSAVEQLPHAETVAGSTPAPAPTSPETTNAPDTIEPTVRNAPAGDSEAPAQQANAPQTQEGVYTPGAVEWAVNPAAENAALNPTGAPPAPMPAAPASAAPLADQIDQAAAGPSQAAPVSPPTEPAITPAAVGGTAPAPATPVDVGAGAGPGALNVGSPTQPIQYPGGRQVYISGGQIFFRRQDGHRWTPLDPQSNAGMISAVLKSPEFQAASLAANASAATRIREDLPEAKPIIARLDALTKIGEARQAAMAPGQVKDMTHPQDMLTPTEKAEFHALQLRLRRKTPAEAKADLAIKRATTPEAPAKATVTSTPAGPEIAPKLAEDRRVSQLVDSKQFKVQREYLLDAVRKARAVAPKTGPGVLTVEVPGDGTFKISHTQDALQRFGDIIEKRFGKSFSLPVQSGVRGDARRSIYSPFSSPVEGSRVAPKSAAVVPVTAKPTANDLTKAAQLGVSTDPTRAGLHHVMTDSGFSIGTDGRVLFAVGGGGGKTRAEIEKLGLRSPDWRNVTPKWIKANDGLIAVGKGAPMPIPVNTREAIKAINQAELVTSEKIFSIRLHKLANGAIGTSAFSPDFGDYMSDGVTEKHKPFVAANPTYLREAMVAARMAGHEHVQLFPPKDGGAIVVKGGDNFMALVMPVRADPIALKDASPVSSSVATPTPKPVPAVGTNFAPVTPGTPPVAATPATVPDWANKPIVAQNVMQPPLMQTPASQAPLLARIKGKIAHLEALRAKVEETGVFPTEVVQNYERRAAAIEGRLERVEKLIEALEEKGDARTKAEESQLNLLQETKDKLYDDNEAAQGDLKDITHNEGENGLEVLDRVIDIWKKRQATVEAVRVKAAQAGTLNDVGAGFTPRSGGRSAASPGPAFPPPMGTPQPPPTMLRPVDNPDFSQLPIQLPEMVQFYRMISGGKNPRIVETIKALHGTALGVFRYMEGKIDSGRIELRADLFHLLSQAEKDALMHKAVAWAKLMKEANPDLHMGDAIRAKFEELVKQAEAEAMTRDPARALAVFAHEIGHYIDFLPNATLRRGNILGHMATLKHYLEGMLGEAPDIMPVPPSDSEKARLRRQAEKETLASVQEITETITREEPIYKVSGLTAKNITEIVGQTAREDFPEFYDWFAKLGRADKVDILKKAMKGIIDERAAQFGKREQTGTQTITEKVTRTVGDASPEAIEKRFQELLRAELKRRGLISIKDIKRELEAVIAWWHKRETMPAYFRSGVEMYAETFSVFMNNPRALEERAPTWWKAFNQYLVRKPEVKKLYDKLQTDIKSGVIFQQRVENLRESWQADEDAGLTNELTREKIPWRKYRDLLTMHFNKQQGPIQALAMKQFGKPEAANLLGALKDYLYRQTAVEGLARQINMRVEAPLARMNLSHADLSEYMFHNRIVNGDAVQTANSQGWSPNTSTQRLQEMAKDLGPLRFGALQQANQQLRNIYEAGPVALLAKSRTLNPDTMQKIQSNIAYSPFEKARDAFNPLDEGTIRGMLESQYGQTATARIYRRIGYVGDIKSPYVALVKKAESLTRFAYKQIATKAIRDFLVKYNSDMIAQAPMTFNGHRMVPRDLDTAEVGTLYTLDDGNLTGWYVPRVIFETLERASGTEQMLLGAALRVLAWPKAILTELNFGFWPVRFFRDLGALGIQIPGGIGAMRNLPKAYAAARATFTGKPNEIADQLLSRLMVISRADPRGEHIGNPDEMDRWLMRLNKHPELWEGETSKIQYALRLWEVYKQQAQIFGRTIKAATMMHLDAKYGAVPPTENIQWVSMPEWMKKRIVNEFGGHAELLERGASTAFAEVAGGPIFVNAWLRSYEAFYKAQGLEPGLKQLGPIKVPTINRQKGFNDPVGVWTKFLMFVGLPALAFYAYEKGWTNFGMDPVKAEDERAMLRSIPERDKLRGFIKTLGWVDKKQGKVAYIVLPFPEQVRTLHAAWRKMLQSFNHDQGRKLGVGSVLNYGGQDVPGTNPMLTEAKNWWDFAALGHNPYDSFRGKLVLDEKVFAAGQGTSQLAKQSLADMTGGMWPQPVPQVPGETPTKLEEFLHAPVIGNLVGRWVRISNAGLGEQDQAIIQPVAERRAQLQILGDQMLTEITQHIGWSKSELEALSMEPYLGSYLMERMKTFTAGAVGPEVGDFMKGNNEEKAALLKAWMDRAAAARARVQAASGRN